MNHRVARTRCTSLLHGASVLVAALWVQGMSPLQPPAHASALLHIARPIWEWDAASQVPGEFRVSFQHDKPLVVEGRVTDTAGKPLEGADVAVIVRLPSTYLRPFYPQVLKQVTTDRSGAFRASMPSLPPYQIQKLYVIARQAGYGMGVAELDSAALQPTLTFRLDKDQPIKGRVIGPDGAPAAGVRVDLRLIRERWPEDPKGRSPVSIASCAPQHRPSAWPEPAMTDDQGRFVLRGIHRSKAPLIGFRFSVDDPRFAPLDPDLMVSVDGEDLFWGIRPDGSEELTLPLEPARFVEGTVICKDTRRPMPGAWLSVVFSGAGVTGDLQSWGIWVKTDERGQFRVRGRPRPFVTIYVYPPKGLPYPAWVRTSMEWPKDTVRQEVMVEVPRGILVRGRVVQEDSGTGVAGALIEYQVRRKATPHYDDWLAHQIYWAGEYYKVQTGSDGTFQIAVVPGVGYLMVKAPTPDYVSRYVTHGELQYDRRGGFWYVLEGLARIEPKPDVEAMDVTIALRRGLPVHGRVEGPQGEPVDKAIIVTLAYKPMDFSDPFSGTAAWPRPVTNSHFELQGCDPDKPQRVYFLDTEHRWGATVDLDATKAQRESPTIRLRECGAAKARFVGQQGKPWVNASLPVSLHLIFAKAQAHPVYPVSDHLEWSMTPLDRRGYNSLRTDADGRVTLSTIVPNAPYLLRLQDEPMVSESQKKEKELEFTVESGQTVDLGDVILKRP